MKKIISKLNAAVQVILLAPVKLPAKAMSIIRYVALGLGIIEKVIEDHAVEKEQSTDEDIKRD